MFVAQKHFTTVVSRFVIAIVLCLGFLSCAFAQAGFTFDLADQDTNSGTDSVYFDGVLTNGTDTSNLLGFSINFDLDNAVDTSPLQDYMDNSAPDPLPSNYNTNITFFTISVPYSIATGLYSGSLSLDYFSNGASNTSTQGFTLNVTQVAGFGMTLDTPAQSVVADGSSVVFNGLFDNGSTETKITGYAFAFLDDIPGLTVDFSDFDNRLTNNDLISPSTYASEVLFRVTADSSVAPDDYMGLATIFFTTNGRDDSISQSFLLTTVASTVVPEANTFILLGGSFVIGAVVFRWGHSPKRVSGVS